MPKTIRSEINRKKRTVVIAIYSGFAFFTIGMMVSDKTGSVPILPLIGFGVAFIAIIYAFYGIRCPKCNGLFGYVTMNLGGPFDVSKKIKFCPFCGVSIDSELHNH